MKLIAIMPVRDEAWILPFTVPAVLRWCDAILICDHASTDNTPEILEALRDTYPDRVATTRWPKPDWDEADIRQDLLGLGRTWGGTHFALIDADEVLTGNMLDLIRTIGESLSPAKGLRLPWLCLWRSLDKVRDDDSPFGRALAPVLFCDGPEVSFKPNADGYQIHTRAPVGVQFADVADRSRGLMHLQHVNWRRCMAKQQWYAETDRKRWGHSEKEVARRYGPTTDETGLILRDVPEEWWSAYGESRNVIDVDAEWRERETCSQ